MDYTLYRAIDARGPHVVDELFKFLATDLPVVIVALVALLFLLAWRHARRQRREGAVAATAAAALALLINQPIAHAVDRTRPYLTHPHATLLIARSHDPSFPSDHATGAFAIATAIWFYDRTAGALFLVLAALLAFARVYVGTHYPSDVLGGAAIGATVAIALRWAPLRRVLERFAGECSRLWETITRVGSAAR